MNPLHEKRKVLGHQRAFFGGDSSQDSTSTQITTTTVTDNRSVVSIDNRDNSVNTNSGNTTNTNSGNTINTLTGWTVGGDVSLSNVGNTTFSSSSTVTDHGAVSGALAATASNTGLVMALADKLAGGSVAIAQKNTDLTAQLSQDAKSAYAGAAAAAGGQTTMIIMIAGIVGLAFAMRK